MSHTLILLRHAKSDWDSGVATDFERPLNARGQRDAPRIGRWLHAQYGRPDFILCSPAERTRQTAVAVCQQSGFALDRVRWDEHIYEAPPGTLLARINEAPAAAQTLLLIGHNPGLEGLLHLLPHAPPPYPLDGKWMPTAAVAVLRCAQPWHNLEPRTAEFVEVQRVKDLADS